MIRMQKSVSDTLTQASGAGLKTRHLVFDVLLPFEHGRAGGIHLEDALSRAFAKTPLSAEDRGFSTYLAYGVLRHWGPLSTLIESMSQRPLKKLDPAVRLLLRLGLFQLGVMARVPDYAAVSTTLDLATRHKLSTKSRGFLNALLQRFIREGKVLPAWQPDMLPAFWQEVLPADVLSATLHAMAAPPRLGLRVNTLKTSPEVYVASLAEAGIVPEPVPAQPEMLLLPNGVGDPTALPGYADGLFLVQDPASAQVVPFLDPQPGETILEIGAAPGTKTTHLAARMQNQGRIVSVDSSESRMTRWHENMSRLGVMIAEAHVEAGPPWALAAGFLADRVLVDAPCSSSGTVAKHPELLLTLTAKTLAAQPAVQGTLLAEAFRWLKPGGVLVYSTCSVAPAENEAVVQAFLQAHEGRARLEATQTLLPTATSDGFYLAKLVKLGY